MGEVGLSFCDYADEVSLGFSEVSFVRQIFNITGSAIYSGGATGEVRQGSGSKVLPTDVPLKFRFSSSYRHLVLRIDQNRCCATSAHCWG
jgi:hypothetical protein